MKNASDGGVNVHKNVLYTERPAVKKTNCAYESDFDIFGIDIFGNDLLVYTKTISRN